MIYGGLQSLLFYTSMTWLPTMAVQAGLSKVESGLLASVFTLISLPYSLTVPSLTTRLSDQKRHLMLVILVGAGILGVTMLLVPTSNFFYWLLINALIGSCVSALFPYLMVTFSMKSTTPEKRLNCLVCLRPVATSLQPWVPSSLVTANRSFIHGHLLSFYY